MTKYAIEGGIDFYEELYKSLDNEQNDNQDCCLITNLPLDNDFVKLECLHKFNYGPLFKELCKQKRNVNDENYNITKMLIKCPYCRCLQSNLLPPKEGFKLIYGVNTSTKLNTVHSGYIPAGYIEGKCEYTFQHLVNPDHIVICDTPYVVKIDNGKCYCYYHKYLGMKQMWDEAKQKIKQKKMEVKLKLKQEKEQQKMETLIKLKQEKEKQKMEIKNKAKQEKEQQKMEALMNANQKPKCTQIIKTGARKGLACDCKVFENNLLCLRHHNLNL
jgi:hypothetical protein